MEFIYVFVLSISKLQFTVLIRNLPLPDHVHSIIIVLVTQTWNCVIIFNSSSSPASPCNITTTIGNQWPNIHPLWSDFQPLSTIAPPSQRKYFHQNSPQFVIFKTASTWPLSHLGSRSSLCLYHTPSLHVGILAVHQGLVHLSSPESFLWSLGIKRFIPDYEISKHALKYYSFTDFYFDHFKLREKL